MVDETEFRQALFSANLQNCTFGKAVLSRCCGCSLVAKHYIAERESIVCSDASYRENCHSLHQLLRHNSAFALKHIHDDDPFTHAQEMKLQCGGLKGLQDAVEGTESVADVASLVESACRKFGTLESLPFSKIVQSIAAFKIRKRHNVE